MSGIKMKATKAPQIIIDVMGDHFLEVARHLHETQKNYPGVFRSVAKQLNIGIRKAFHLARISRTFDDLGVPIDRLRRIGWTKLAHLAPYVDAGNVDEWLTVAETATAYELKMLLRGHKVDPDTRAVVMYLDKSQYDVFEAALLTAGAIKQARSLLNKEEALIRLLSSSPSG